VLALQVESFSLPLPHKTDLSPCLGTRPLARPTAPTPTPHPFRRVSLHCTLPARSVRPVKHTRARSLLLHTMAKPPAADDALPAKEHAVFRSIVKFYDAKQYKKGVKAADTVLK